LNDTAVVRADISRLETKIDYLNSTVQNAFPEIDRRLSDIEEELRTIKARLP